MSESLKVNLLFPLEDNDGEPFDEDVWGWWRSEMTVRFAGYTDLGKVKGYWEGYSDQHRMVVMVLPDSELPAVRRFLQEARERFRQEAMYLDHHPVVLELIR